jgi:hypothetical protein
MPIFFYPVLKGEKNYGHNFKAKVFNQCRHGWRWFAGWRLWGKKAEGEVTAVEDLMREYGVIRRALLVYQGISPKLKDNPTAVIVDSLRKTANLFRAFGEDYHEKNWRRPIYFLL